MTRMKESGIDWIGQIPEEWEIVKFKYLFNTSKGLSITKEYLVDEGIPVINYGQIHSSLTKQVQSCDVRLPFVANYYLSKKGVKLNQGDFVFADTSEDLEGAGNFSTRLDSTGQLLAGYHTIIARLNDYDEHDFRYFMHLFDSLAIRKQIQNKVSGIKVYSITQGILNSIFVIIPPKSEQQKIADFLDKKTAQLDKVKSLLEEQIQKLKAYRASLIYETVTKGLDKNVPMKDPGIDWIGKVPQGWGVSKLKNLLKIKDGTHDTPSYVDSGIPLITTKNINSFSNYIDFSTAKNISYKDYILINRRSDVEYGDILMPMIGTVGGAVQVTTKNSFSIKNVALFKAGFDLIMSKYLYYQLNSDIVNNQLEFLMSGGVQSFVSISILEQLQIINPSEKDKKKIVRFLDEKTQKIDKLIQIKNQQIENINKQRQTLIYDYVTGKRRV